MSLFSTQSFQNPISFLMNRIVNQLLSDYIAVSIYITSVPRFSAGHPKVQLFDCSIVYPDLKETWPVQIL